MKVEITNNNVSGTGAEILDYSVWPPNQSRVWSHSLPKLSSIVLLSENLEGPRCHFRLENDNVTLPMPLLLHAQLYHN